MSYELVGITGEGELVNAPKPFANAPTASQMGAFASRNKCAFVMRYYPSRKGWLVHDTRSMVALRVNGGRNFTYKMLRGSIVYPSRDAAEMSMIHKHSWPQPVKKMFA